MIGLPNLEPETLQIGGKKAKAKRHPSKKKGKRHPSKKGTKGKGKGRKGKGTRKHL